MMELGLQFDEGLDRILQVFEALPDPIRPTHFSHGEKTASKANRITDSVRFRAFVEKSKSGFFLLGQDLSYSIRITKDQPIVCDCFLELAPDLAESLLIKMAKASPIFGFACLPEERRRRNKIVIDRNSDRTEYWVGRDPRYYIPGLYWMTLIPKSLAERHGISIGDLESAAESHLELEGGQHLFRFYRHPEDWQSSTVVSSLIAVNHGFFDVKRVLPEVSAAKDILELGVMLRKWK